MLRRDTTEVYTRTISDNHQIIIFYLEFLPPTHTRVTQRTGRPTMEAHDIRNVAEAKNEFADLPDVEIHGKSFKFKGQKMMCTFRGHIAKGELSAHILSKVGSLVDSLKFVRCAHESADELHPYLHTHVLVDFGKSIAFENSRRFDFGDVHPNIKAVKTPLHWKNAKKYLSKEDPENGDLAEKPSIIDGIFNCKSSADALRKYADPTARNAQAILAVYNNRPTNVFRDLPNPHPWQEWLCNLIEHTKPHPRHIWWIYDPVGDTGKSEVSDYLACREETGSLAIDQCGGSYHFATIIANALISGWNGKSIILDLPRKSEDLDIYGPIESIKNGRVTALKYQGKPYYLPNRPHVVVMSNYLPKIRDQAGKLTLTLDRWKILEIRSDGLDFTEKSRKKCGLPPSTTTLGPPKIHDPDPIGDNPLDLVFPVEDQKDPPGTVIEVARGLFQPPPEQPKEQHAGITAIPDEIWAMFHEVVSDFDSDVFTPKWDPEIGDFTLTQEWDPEEGAFGAAAT